MARLTRLMLAAAALGAQPAMAQMLPPDEGLVRFNRFTAVRDRVVPGYAAPGVRVGSFTLSPALETSAEYNDNIFALDTAQVDDVYVRLAPSALLQSNWQGRSLSLSANGRIDRYADRTSENTEAVDTSAYGIQEFGDSTRLRLIGRYRQDRESRESQNAFVLTDRPVRFETSTAAIGVSQRFASALVSAEAGITRYNFFDARLNGGTLDQDYRDADLRRLRLRAELAQSPSLAYFAQGTYDDTKYRNENGAGLGRSSKIYELLGGVRFELPIAVRGEIGIGYLRADYRGAQFRSFSGIGIDSRVLFFPSELTTITVTASRRVNDAGIIASSGYVALTGGARVDHELLRNLILSANVQYERDTFNGIDRRDRRFSYGANADYRLNRTVWARISYDGLDLKSDGLDRYKTFTRNRVMFGIGVRV